MRISLLFPMIFVMTSTVVFAQMSTRPSPKDTKPQEKKTFDKFYDRLRIGYFGVVTTPHLDDIDRGKWRNAAVSPEWGNAPKGKGKNQDTFPTNVWNQVSFNYNFGAKMNFVVNPRFIVSLAHEKDIGTSAPEDRSTVFLDDVLLGFQGVVYSSEDKKLNIWIRPGLRLPTSRPSRNLTNRGDGAITHQPELAYLPTYDFNKTWQVGIFGQVRSWIMEDQYNLDRLRLYTAPYVQYTIDDVSRVQLYYEDILETDRRGKPQGDRNPVFKNYWQNVFMGYSRDYTSKFNAMPFIGCFVNDTPITDKSVWFGAWVSYQIK